MNSRATQLQHAIAAACASHNRLGSQSEQPQACGPRGSAKSMRGHGGEWHTAGAGGGGYA